MSEKMSEVYGAYDMEVYQTNRGRGATILKTDKGQFQLKSLDVSESRILAEYNFKEELYINGFRNIDRCVKNSEGELVTLDRYGNAYVLRMCCHGRECNVTRPEEIDVAVDNLASFHMVGKKIFDNTEKDVHVRNNGDFKKRNREIKRVRNFIGKLKARKEFENLYLRAYEHFSEKTVECEKSFAPFVSEKMSMHTGYCHGMYNHHSVLMGNDGVVSTVSFDKFFVGNQLTDLYHFMRKTVEKNRYNVDIMKRILERYARICPLTARDLDYIYILYCYPEKFYKISNQYMNAPKNWISPKMIEKLNKVIYDEVDKERILNELKIYKSIGK